MTKVTIQNREGKTQETIKWDGAYFPNIINFNICVSEDDSIRDRLGNRDYSRCNILMASYPRSGYHWVYEHVNMLKTKTLSVCKTTGMDTIIELGELFGVGLQVMSEQRILQTHLTPEYMPDNLLNQKVVYTYRNPKDVFCSKYNIAKEATGYSGTFEEFTSFQLEGKIPFGCWFDHTLKWEKICRERNYCVMCYEELTKNPLPSLRRLAQYLEVDADNEFLMAVHQACSIDNMRCKNSTGDKTGKELTLVRQGGIGRWKNHFTVALSEKFDRVFAQKMKDCKLEIHFT